MRPDATTDVVQAKKTKRKKQNDDEPDDMALKETADVPSESAANDEIDVLFKLKRPSLVRAPIFLVLSPRLLAYSQSLYDQTSEVICEQSQIASGDPESVDQEVANPQRPTKDVSRVLDAINATKRKRKKKHAVEQIETNSKDRKKRSKLEREKERKQRRQFV